MAKCQRNMSTNQEACDLAKPNGGRYFSNSIAYEGDMHITSTYLSNTSKTTNSTKNITLSLQDLIFALPLLSRHKFTSIMHQSLAPIYRKCKVLQTPLQQIKPQRLSILNKTTFYGPCYWLANTSADVLCWGHTMKPDHPIPSQKHI